MIESSYYNTKTGHLLEQLIPPHHRSNHNGVKTIHGPTKRLDRVWQFFAKLFHRAEVVKVDSSCFYVDKASWAKFISENKYLGIDAHAPIDETIRALVQDVRTSSQLIAQEADVATITRPAVALSVLWKRPELINAVDQSLFSNPHLIEQICANGQALQTARKSVVKKLILQSPFASRIFRSIKPEIRDNTNVAMAFLEKDPSLFSQFSKSNRESPSIAMAAISKIGTLIVHASKSLQKQRPYALEAAKHGCPLSSLRRRFWKDKEIVLAYIANNQDPSPVLDLSPKLVKEPDVRLALIQKKGSFISAFPDLQDNREVASIALASGGSLRSLSSRLRDDLSLVKTALSQNRWAIRDASLRLKIRYILSLIPGFRFLWYPRPTKAK
jgi:hypothetical protein